MQKKSLQPRCKDDVGNAVTCQRCRCQDEGNHGAEDDAKKMCYNPDDDVKMVSIIKIGMT